MKKIEEEFLVKILAHEGHNDRRLLSDFVFHDISAEAMLYFDSYENMFNKWQSNIISRIQEVYGIKLVHTEVELKDIYHLISLRKKPAIAV